MFELFFHTIINILWIIILTAVAAIATSIAYVVVRVIFCNGKVNFSTKNNEKE